MHRYFVTGTDTDVGKTRVVAALALALAQAGHAATIVKIVQTGADDDAATAAALSGVGGRELARFDAPADPLNAAVRAGVPPLEAAYLAEELKRIAGALVAEGSGGLMVPLNEREHLGDVAVAAGLEAILAVGLRLGCINHALLTEAACRRLALPLAGAVLVERWHPVAPAYRHDVARALQGKMKILGIVPFAPDARSSIADDARLFDSLLK